MRKGSLSYEIVSGIVIGGLIVLSYVQASTIQQQHNDIVEAERKVRDIQATCMQYELEINSLLGSVNRED